MPQYTNVRPTAGMNVFGCPVCESTTMVPLNLRTYYKIMVAGGGASEAKCPRGHRFEIGWRVWTFGGQPEPAR